MSYNNQIIFELETNSQNLFVTTTSSLETSTDDWYLNVRNNCIDSQIKHDKKFWLFVLNSKITFNVQSHWKFYSIEKISHNIRLGVSIDVLWNRMNTAYVLTHILERV